MLLSHFSNFCFLFFRNKKQAVEDDTWNILLKMTETDKDSVFFIAKSPDTENLEILFIQTSQMRKVLGQYHDVVNLDGTYCINNLGFPCYVFMVADGENAGNVVAYALVKDETTATLSCLLSEFSKLNPNLNIKTFIVDKDAAEIGAIKTVFPTANILLCYFHVRNNFLDANRKYSKNCSEQERENNERALEQMLKTTSEHNFLKYFDSLTDDLKVYLQKNWMPIVESWARFKTKHIETWGYRTNNIVERHNRTLKTLCSSDTSLPKFINNILAHHKLKEKQKKLSIAKLRLTSRVQACPVGTPPQIVAAIKDIIPKVTSKALSYIMGEVEVLPKVHDKNIVTDFGIYFLGGDNEKHSYECQFGKCQCVFYLERQLPCWHLMLYNLKKEKEIFPTIPSKWLVETLEKSLYEDNYDKGETPQINVFSREIEQKALDNVEKAVKANNICKDLVSVMVSCGTKTFLERCKVLEALESCWRTGRKVHSLFCETKGKGESDELQHIDFSFKDENDDIKELNEDVSDLHQVDEREVIEQVVGLIDVAEGGVLEQMAGGDEVERGDRLVERDMTDLMVAASEGGSQEEEALLDNTQADNIRNQCLKAPFNLVKRITKKGRPKIAKSKIFKKKVKQTVNVGSILDDPFVVVEQGTIIISDDDDEMDEHNTGMIVDHESLVEGSGDKIICKACGKEEVSLMSEQAKYCEIVRCDFCKNWFHDVCVTGNKKVYRGMAFKCPLCRR